MTNPNSWVSIIPLERVPLDDDAKAKTHNPSYPTVSVVSHALWRGSFHGARDHLQRHLEWLEAHDLH